MPCKIIEPSCQGGQSSLVRFWCKEKVVPQVRLTRDATAAEGRAISGNSILGMPEIEQDQRASRGRGCTAQDSTQAASREHRDAEMAQCGNSILGVPEIEQALSRADQNRKADAHAEGPRYSRHVYSGSTESARNSAG